MLKNRSKIHWNMLCCKTNLIFMENKKRYASTTYIKAQNIGKIQPNTTCVWLNFTYILWSYTTQRGCLTWKRISKLGIGKYRKNLKHHLQFKRGVCVCVCVCGICSLPYQQHITLISCPLQCYYILPNISIGLGPALKWKQQTMWDWDFHLGVRDKNVWSFTSTALMCHNYVA